MDSHAGKVGDYSNVYHTIGANSTVYIEGCNIIGRLYFSIKGENSKVVLGGGNVINSTQNLNTSRFVAADGTKIAYASDAKNSFEFTVSVSHPHFYLDYEEYLTKSQDGTKWVLKDGIFDKADTVASVTKSASVVTIEDGEIHEIAKNYITNVNW